jgi:hypothetical protein
MRGMYAWKKGERYNMLDAAGRHEERIETNGLTLRTIVEGEWTIHDCFPTIALGIPMRNETVGSEVDVQRRTARVI